MLLDDIDLALIKELEKDARVSSDALAQSLDISSTTIRRRTRRLIQEGVIKYGTPRGKDALGEQRHSRHAIEPIYYGLQF